jgi:hypothetical protein
LIAGQVALKLCTLLLRNASVERTSMFVHFVSVSWQAGRALVVRRSTNGC